MEEKEVQKTPLLPQSEPDEDEIPVESRVSYLYRCRAAKILLITILSLYVLVVINHVYQPFCHRRIPLENYRPDYEEPAVALKVPLEAHIMSKCPDAQDCLRDLIVPAMEKIADKVDFRLSYIGEPSDNGNGVACKHGPDECLGNIIQLCAAYLYPDPKTHLGFAMCTINDYEDIPQQALIHDCALEYGIDFDSLNECASRDDGAFGLDMLRKSVVRSSEANVTYSCTVRLDESIRCIRDGGEWKSCAGGSEAKDLIRDVKDLSAAYAAGA